MQEQPSTSDQTPLTRLNSTINDRADDAGSAGTAGSMDCNRSDSPARVPRFWVPNLPDPVIFAAEGSGAKQGVDLPLGETEARHAFKVLRLRVGEAVVLFDGAGGQAEGRIKTADKRGVVVTCLKVVRVDRAQESFGCESDGDAAVTAGGVVVAAAMPKGAKAEDMVDQLSQIGVQALVPLQTQRSVVEANQKKQARLERRALEACKQCGRLWAMAIDEPVSLVDLVLKPGQVQSEHAADVDWVVMDTQGQLALPELMDEQIDEQTGCADQSKVDQKPRKLGLLIGPEGGWSDQERAALDQAQVYRWRLPSPVMRLETAAVVGAALMLHGRPGPRPPEARPPEVNPSSNCHPCN